MTWLETEVRPDIVHLSNALLLGMAPAIRRRLEVPIVCGLAGEDWFVEQLKEPHYSRVRELLRVQAKQANHFVAYNQYFADFMADYIAADPSRISVIRHGMDLERQPQRPPKEPGEPMTIGYFGRVAPEKGLDLLIEAFGILSADPSLPPSRLRYGGYKSAADEAYFQKIQNRIRELRIDARTEHLGELDRAKKMEAIQSFDIMAVPTIYRESKGLSALEALANGVPIVVPAHGAFPELISETAGGLLHEPSSANDLAAKLKLLLTDRALLEECGRRGSAAIQASFTAARMAGEHRRLYERLVAEQGVAIQHRPPSPSRARAEIVGR
jgi:glycosyltransferase involved in cell wall biosynthesis